MLQIIGRIDAAYKRDAFDVAYKNLNNSKK